jgi:pimeloyl-ACP methyl ester carboxylesterase
VPVSVERPRFRVSVADGVGLSLLRREPEHPAEVAFVLVHGLASNARTWDGVADELARHGHASVAVDLRGHGHSDKPDDGYDVASVASDLGALLRRLGLDRPVLVGQSWGGNVVLETAARDPALVRGVVAVDGGTIELAEAFPTFEACWETLAPPRLDGTTRRELESWLREAHPDWPESGIQGALASFELRPDGTVAPWLTRARHMAVLRGLWEHSPSRRYADVPVPVLLVPAASARDDHARAVSEREHVERALALLPRARVRWFADTDHDIHAHRPADLAAVLMEAVRDGFLDP